MSESSAARLKVGGQPGPAVVTFAVLAACLVGYAIEVSVAGIAPTPRQLHDMGAVSSGALSAGELWRIATSTFLHADPLHLLNNVVVIALIGIGLERFVGHLRTGLVAVASAAGAGIGATVAVDPGVVSVGASGIAFGMLAAAVVGDRGMRDGIGMFGAQLLAINLVVTFTVTGISVGGHLGGGIAGALVALERRLRTPVPTPSGDEASPTSLPPPTSHAPEEVLELRERRAGLVRYLVIISAVVALGAWVGSLGQPMGWLLAGLGGVGVVAQLRSLASPGTLVLTPHGLRSDVGRPIVVAWGDVDLFMPAESSGEPGVAWHWKRDSESAPWPDGIGGFVPNQFAVDNLVLAVLLESWRRGQRLTPAAITHDLARETLEDVKSRLEAGGSPGESTTVRQEH